MNKASDPEGLQRLSPALVPHPPPAQSYHFIREGQVQDSSLLVHEPGRVEEVVGEAQVQHAVVGGGQGQRRRGKWRGAAVGQPEKLPLGVTEGAQASLRSYNAMSPFQEKVGPGHQPRIHRGESQGRKLTIASDVPWVLGAKCLPHPPCEGHVVMLTFTGEDTGAQGREVTGPRSLWGYVAEPGAEPRQPESSKHTPNHSTGSASTLQISTEILLKVQFCLSGFSYQTCKLLKRQPFKCVCILNPCYPVLGKNVHRLLGNIYAYVYAYEGQFGNMLQKQVIYLAKKILLSYKEANCRWIHMVEYHLCKFKGL